MFRISRNYLSQVLVTGGGPSGAVLALWLKEQGIDVRVIDKHHGAAEQSRATIVQARVLELYRQLGIADKVASTGLHAKANNMWAAGKKRASLNFDAIGKGLSPYPYMLIYPQDLHEKMLVEELSKRGVTIERDTELIDFSQDGKSVTAQIRLPSGEVQQSSFDYMAGCDGASSTVRHAMGSSFQGGTYAHMFYVADIEVENEDLQDEAHMVIDHGNVVGIMPYNVPHLIRIFGTIKDPEDGKPLTQDDIDWGPLNMVGLKVKKFNWFSTYHVHHRVTDYFRKDRVFLCGDAAHVHSPAGGQGLNTGVSDAINLAWKLSSVLKGKGGDNLLVSYEQERPAFAKKLVATTDNAFSYMVQEGTLIEFARMYIYPVFMKKVASFETAQKAAFKVISQILVNYHESLLSEGEVGDVHGGDRLPYVTFPDGSDNFKFLSNIGWQIHVYGTATPELKQWSEAEGVPLHEISWQDSFSEAGLTQDAVYVLRPDTYVGLAMKGGSDSAATVKNYFASRNIKPGQ